MRGNATDDGREALMPVEVLSSSGSETLRVEVLVDTGFTGHLTLSPASADALSLRILGSVESL